VHTYVRTYQWQVGVKARDLKASLVALYGPRTTVSLAVAGVDYCKCVTVFCVPRRWNVWEYGLQCVAVCCSVLQCAAVCCSVLQCRLPLPVLTTVSVLPRPRQHTATRCRSLQHAAMHRSMLQHTATRTTVSLAVADAAYGKCITYFHANTLQHTTTTCCNMLQHAAICCNMLQYAATLRYAATHFQLA